MQSIDCVLRLYLCLCARASARPSVCLRAARATLREGRARGERERDGGVGVHRLASSLSLSLIFYTDQVPKVVRVNTRGTVCLPCVSVCARACAREPPRA